MNLRILPIALSVFILAACASSGKEKEHASLFGGSGTKAGVDCGITENGFRVKVLHTEPNGKGEDTFTAASGRTVRVSFDPRFGNRSFDVTIAENGKVQAETRGYFVDGKSILWAKYRETEVGCKGESDRSVDFDTPILE